MAFASLDASCRAASAMKARPPGVELMPRNVGSQNLVRRPYPMVSGLPKPRWKPSRSAVELRT